MTTTLSTTVLDVQDLRFAYPGEPPLVDRWTTAIAPGLTLLFGDTGSGKTTLLNVIAGTRPAAGGRLTLAGARLDADPAAYRRALFWCDPATEAFNDVTARACTAALSAGDERFDPVAWQSLADGFALAPHLDKPMYMLSTGSKRKVYLAAALASGRALTLLDEPTGALDAASIGHLMRRLAVLASQPERAIIVASYDRPAALAFARVIELPIGADQGA
ncbi:MAG TPA: energy-coupling factor ABC transporter ATP-binding protein [Burkholderiaceae bacterium]|jgi:ABC-type multidrug transport system ATPase subunit